MKQIVSWFLIILAFSLSADLIYQPQRIMAENATATWCTHCPDVYAGLEVVHSTYDFSEFASVRYYATSGDYGTPETQAAIDYYEITSYPTTVFQGLDEIVGGGTAIESGTPFLGVVQRYYFAPSPVRVEITSYNNQTGDISVSVEMFDPSYAINNAFLRLILIEDDVTAEYTHLTRDIINTNFSMMGSGDTFSYSDQFVIPTGVNSDNLQAAVFVQLPDHTILNSDNTYDRPAYKVRAIVPFNMVRFGPSSGLYVEEPFTIYNDGLADEFLIRIILDEAPAGTYVTFCDENNCYPSQAQVFLDAEGYQNYNADIQPGGPGMVRYHFEVSSANTDTLFIPFTYITDDVDALLVDDDGGENYEEYFTQALITNGYTLGIWNLDSSKLTEEVTLNIPNLIWNVGWNFPSLDAVDRAFLETYLDNGNSLFLSGQDIGWDLNESTDNSDVDFYHNYLHASYISDDINDYNLTGLPGDAQWGGLSLHIAGGDGADNQEYPSAIQAFDAAAEEILFYSVGEAGALRAVHPASNAKLVYFAFGYEAIDNAFDREIVMAIIMNWFTSGSGTEGNDLLPVEPVLFQNQPNPFNPVTRISFQLPQDCQEAELSIHNSKGQLIRSYLLNPSTLQSLNSVVWDGRDNKGHSVASGLYFYRLKSGTFTFTRKMIMMK